MNEHDPILLVEDDPMAVDLAKRAFAKRNIVNPMEVARDGEEALFQLTRWEAGAPVPAVVLLDMKLPKVSGLEVLRRIKQHPRFSTVPVVMLTSSSEDSDVQQAYRLGVNSYILKPYHFDQFMDLVGQLQTYWCVLNFLPR